MQFYQRTFLQTTLNKYSFYKSSFHSIVIKSILRKSYLMLTMQFIQQFHLKYTQLKFYIVNLIFSLDAVSFPLLKSSWNILPIKCIPDAAQIFSLLPSYVIILETGVNTHICSEPSGVMLTIINKT
jgi:hypothetical protein